MRSISYRAKTRWKKGIQISLLLLGLLLLLVVLAVIYLGRFVVYTPDGVRLDFGRDSSRDIPTQSGQPPVTAPPERIEIEFADPDPHGQSTEPVSGWYVDLEMLQDPGAVLEALQELSAPCTVLIDLKGGNGSFYYSTAIDGARSADIDIKTADGVISYLRNHGFTMIARIRSFQDSHFAELHNSCALQIAGGALWVSSGFYWLDPGNETVLAYLKQIARELAAKGFEEIVFDDFHFPKGTQIVYNSNKDRSELIADVAKDLLNFFSSSNITISFGNPTTDFSPPAGSRIYLSGVTGTGISAAVRSYAHLENPQTQLIFLTSSKDNRFDSYQVLRPLLNKAIQ